MVLQIASPSIRQNPDVIYIPNVALYRSEDGGKTIFDRARRAGRGDDYHQLWIDPRNSASMVLGTDQGNHDQPQPRPDVEQLVQPAHGHSSIM